MNHKIYVCFFNGLEYGWTLAIYRLEKWGSQPKPFVQTHPVNAQISCLPIMHRHVSSYLIQAFLFLYSSLMQDNVGKQNAW